jgi:hypothetical protein
MITPPDNIQQLFSKPCYSNISTESSPKPLPQLPLNTTVSTSGPFINCNENLFGKLTKLEVYSNIIS